MKNTKRAESDGYRKMEIRKRGRRKKKREKD